MSEPEKIRPEDVSTALLGLAVEQTIDEALARRARLERASSETVDSIDRSEYVDLVVRDVGRRTSA